MPDQHDRGTLEAFAKRARDLRSLNNLDAAAAEAFSAFEAVGVDALLLKGPALARILYRADEHRGYSDVDLLVAPRDLQRARQALADLGYRNIREGLGIDEVLGALDAETWTAAADPDTAGLMIDLHWRLVGSRAPVETAWDALNRRRTCIDLQGHTVPVLNPEGLAMQVATHAAQHGHHSSRPIEDLYKGLERWSPDLWRRAAILAREIEATEAFAAGLRLVGPGVALARNLGLPATDELQWRIAHRDERPRGTFHLEKFTQATTWADRASVLRRSLFPRREWIGWQYPWAGEGRVRMFAAYGVHLMRAPTWAVRAWRFRRRAGREN